jgi:hypothetical protein
MMLLATSLRDHCEVEIKMLADTPLMALCKVFYVICSLLSPASAFHIFKVYRGHDRLEQEPYPLPILLRHPPSPGLPHRACCTFRPGG